MITPSEAKRRIEKHYTRWCRHWAGELFLEASGLTSGLVSNASPDSLRTRGLTIALNPPTEKAVLADIAASRSWVESWRDSALASQVVWAEKNWKSVGTQRVPEKLLLKDARTVAKAALKAAAWKQVEERTIMLAKQWKNQWQHSAGACATVDPQSYLRCIEKSVAEYAALDKSDWEKLLATLDWLMKNPSVACYVRQLPIRGIDSKWLELHRGAAEPLYTTMTGKTQFSFLKVPQQIRVRFLDKKLAPGGMGDFAASAEELNRLNLKPRQAIVVENLVTLYCLPDLPQTMAFHGGGYAISALADIEWLLKVPVLYWGDLDSHGFAILNRLRHHHPEVTSLMMDSQTLKRHRELCVIENSPNHGVFECLTADEQKVLGILLSELSENNALRLEQERIEWSYALQQIEQAVQAL